MSLFFHLFPMFAVALYAAATTCYVSSLWNSYAHRVLLARRLLGAGFAFHVLSLVYHELEVLSTSASFFPSSAFTLSLIGCLLVGIFFLLEDRLRIGALAMLVSPLALVFLIGSGILFHLDRSAFGSTGPIPRDALLVFHIGATLLGHVAFVFAFGVSVALILQESSLKNKRYSVLQKKLPSLRLLDRLNVRFLMGGFFCMVCGVLAGFLFGFLHEISIFGFNPRVVWSLVTLVVYAVLLGAMTIRGFRGRRAAWLSIAGFCTVVASFVSAGVVGGGFHVH